MILISDIFEDCRKPGGCGLCNYETGVMKPIGMDGALEIEGERLTTCPMHELNPEILFIQHMYVHYQNGFLPEEGGVVDQNNCLMECIGIYGNTNAEILKDKQGK